MVLRNDLSLSKLFEAQVEFQSELLAKMGGGGKPAPLPNQLQDELPTDNLEWFKYHCLAMLEEMGEVMQSDKRWKTHRNERYAAGEKLDELADVFITWCNMAMYSGFTNVQLQEAVTRKISKNMERLKGENGDVKK